jgi:hypothetical protein
VKNGRYLVCRASSYLVIVSLQRDDSSYQVVFLMISVAACERDSLQRHGLQFHLGLSQVQRQQ